ncbi:MAG: SUMF1/EgtB/PvdO family nonheme iron enzyme, partial [Phycisphaerales bacterium]|nr:SUMF1/EgtB/PvdO family nonheme iron enzyme [Phycisphaerales bacterium]
NANKPMRASWRMAARFANWLHNDQADAAWAFETGAYDTSTFGTTQNEHGINVLTDQQQRSEGARFFIPTADEWKKAGFYDPNRYGEEDGGWWLYPTTSDTAPYAAAPEFGGETNGGPFPPGQIRPLDVGSYPHVQSPWGLLDVSGGAHEWMEDFQNPAVPSSRLAGGTSIYFPSPTEVGDHLTVLGGLSPADLTGIRLASVIPSPSPIAVLAVGFSCLFRRHRHEEVPSRERAGRARS